MNFKTILACSIVLMLLLSSCSQLYQKSTLFKTQENEINKLKHDKEYLQKKITSANKDTLEPKQLSLKAVEKDSFVKLPVESSSPFLDVLLGKESQASMRLSYKNATFDILVVKNPADVQLFWKEENKIIGSLHQLKLLAEKENKDLIFATNAGMYTPSMKPQGLYIENGVELVPLDTIKEADGNFYLQPNGVFLIEKDSTAHLLTTEAYKNYDGRVLYATQSGPMVVIEGKINPKFNESSSNLNIRSGVGIDAQGRVIFLISNQEVNFFTFASVFKDVFLCPNALYLDGAISLTYLPMLSRRDLGGNFGPMIGILKSRNR